MGELFSLAGQYQQVYDLMTDPDTDEQIVKDTLESIMGEIEVNASRLAPVLNRLDAEIDICKKQEADWKAKRQIRENSLARLKSLIVTVMDKIGAKEINAGDVTFKVQNAGGQLGIDFVEGVTVPERFTKLTIETDKGLVRKALDAGEELEFAHFTPRGRVLKIK